MGFGDFRKLSAREVIQLIMSKSSDHTFVKDVREFVLPFLRNRLLRNNQDSGNPEVFCLF